MFSKNQIFRFYVLLIFQIVVFGNLPIISQAQQLTYDVQYLSTEEGLSDHRVLAVLEHSMDLLGWVLIMVSIGLMDMNLLQ